MVVTVTEAHQSGWTWGEGEGAGHHISQQDRLVSASHEMCDNHMTDHVPWAAPGVTISHDYHMTYIWVRSRH